MADERCECCDLPVYSCGRKAQARVDKEDRKARRKLLLKPGWFVAKYAGTCVMCGEHFQKGDPVKYVELGLKAWCCWKVKD